MPSPYRVRPSVRQGVLRLRGLFAFTLLMGLTAFLAGCSAVPGVGASSTYSLVGLWLVIASTLGLLVGCGGPSLNASQGGSFPPTVTATPAVSTAVALQFVQQPTARTASAQVLDVITPFPQVEAVDQSGRRVTSFTGAVTLTLSAPAGVTLLGTVTRNAVAGVATFDDLRLSQAGVSYTLQASSGSLQTGTSIAFTTAPLPLAFSTLQTYAAGSFPQGTAVADVNADKIPDLVAADFNNAVSVFLGNGDGTFRSRQTFVTDTFSIEVSVADFNGDTKPDLSVLNNYSASVLLGNGDGTFRAPRQIADSFGGLGGQAVGDVNLDGKIDIALSVRNTDYVVLVLGNGDGTFLNARTFASGSDPGSVALADVNGDKKPDLLCTNANDGSVSVLLGNGDATFLARQTFGVATNTFTLEVVDVNLDGKPDVTTVASGTVSVLLGNGDGTFIARQSFSSGKGASDVAVGDLNLDGKPDLVTANANTNNVSVLLGNGDGTFQTQQAFAVGGTLFSVSVSDLNLDGKPDLSFADDTNKSVSVLLHE